MALARLAAAAGSAATGLGAGAVFAAALAAVSLIAGAASVVADEDAVEAAAVRAGRALTTDFFGAAFFAPHVSPSDRHVREQEGQTNIPLGLCVYVRVGACGRVWARVGEYIYIYIYI